MADLIVNELKIENFKSIKSLTLAPKRINLFIGKPNTGKSNILEALSLFCLPHAVSSTNALNDFVRCEKGKHLFYDQDVKKNVSILAGRFSTKLYREQKGTYHFEFKRLQKILNPRGPIESNVQGYMSFMESNSNSERIQFQDISMNEIRVLFSVFKRYAFRKERINHPQDNLTYLQVPFGENIFYILETHPELFEKVAGFFTQYGLNLVLNQENDTMLTQKKIGNRVFQLPYSLAADTLQRMIFYLATIKTNTKSVLIFEEPETHSFPPYVQILALEIANSVDNQFFIATHSPYLFNTILEKAPKEDVAVFITNFEDYETKVKLLSEEDKSDIMNYGMDVFFHLDEFITEKQLH